jgi:addiction module RelB/DinJ family antitoxin
MAQVSMTVRMDSQLKQSFDALCQQFGMSANTAMNIFANAVVMYRKIPFEIKAEDKQEKTQKNQSKEYPLDPYTMEELYARVAESEEQFAKGNYITSEELFSELDKEFHFLEK